MEVNVRDVRNNFFVGAVVWRAGEDAVSGMCAF